MKRWQVSTLIACSNYQKTCVPPSATWSGSIDINSVSPIERSFATRFGFLARLLLSMGKSLHRRNCSALVLHIAPSGSVDPWRAWDGILGLGRSTIFVRRRYLSKHVCWTCFSAIVGCTMMYHVLDVQRCFSILTASIDVGLAVQVRGDCKCIHCEVWKQWWAHRCSECQRASAQGADKETKGHLTDVLWRVATIWYVVDSWQDHFSIAGVFCQRCARNTVKR